MSTGEALAGTPAVDADVRPTRAWRTIVDTIEGRIGLAVGAVTLALIAFGPMLAPYPPNELGAGPRVQGPTSEHLFGTDSLGRDVLSRFLDGGDSILLVPVLSVTLAFLIGGGLGMLGGYRRGLVDSIITRVFDLLLALPPLLIVLVIIAGAGSSMAVLVLTVALVFVPRVGRIMRGATQAVVTNDYVAAAQARGEATTAIIVREVLPNIASPAIAEFALRLTYAIIFVATLNFLGLGAQPPDADWGLMVAEGRSYITVSPWATLLPAAGIAALSIATNLVADALTRHIARDTTSGRVTL